MTKKRKFSTSSPIKVEVKEENTHGNDYLIAMGRLKGALRQLTEHSSESESDSSTEDKPQRHQKRETAKKRKSDAQPMPYHHTYVMKLFDRSVDLARFEEDTPLYPICRAWMANQPRNPQVVVKRRLSSPGPENPFWNDGNSMPEVRRLPPPSAPFVTRIPSPIPEQMQQNKEDINLNYDEKPPVPRDTLIRNHLKRWTAIKKKWIATAQKNEERYRLSTHLLQTIYNKAQESME